MADLLVRISVDACQWRHWTSIWESEKQP